MLPSAIFFIRFDLLNFQNSIVFRMISIRHCVVAIIVSYGLQVQGQVTLEADGPGDTYALITSVLAPGQNPIETPDCSHPAFGDHIDEVYDSDLERYAFRFHIHTDEDNDRCITFDRQRNEIKTYGSSPQNLKGEKGEEVKYTWMFKLPSGFQSSSNFTHIHQLKSVGGDFASQPMYTLTTRKGTPDKLQLLYAQTTSSVTLLQTDLSPFLDEWVIVTEQIVYDDLGAYQIQIQRVRDGDILLDFKDNARINWRLGAEFVRPKWGIYRSLNNSQDLRDEEVLFADFSIQEIIPEIAYNGVDDDCNPDTPDDDLDGDGYVLATDCNDDNIHVHPNALELCDGIDNNCNVLVDEVCDGTLYCQEDSLTVISSESVYSIAHEYIHSTALIDNEDSTFYYAGDCITLDQGFEVTEGSSLLVSIENCNNVLPNFCYNLDSFIGDSCDDGNSQTSDDTVDMDCNCVGKIIPLIQESGFEDYMLPDGSGDGRDSWRNDIGGVIQITMGPVHEGLQSGKLPKEGDRVGMQEITVSPDSDYTLSFYYTMKSDPGTLTVSILDNFITSTSQLSGATIATLELTDNSNQNTYVYETLDFNSGPNSMVTIYIGNVGSECRFDNFKID